MYFTEFFCISQIWTASDTNNRIKWVEKWYSCYWVQCEALPKKSKEISNILFRKYDHERVAEWFLNSKKANKVRKSWDLSRSHDIIHVGCGKKIEKVFAQSVMYDVYKPKYLRKRIIALRKIRYDLESKWRSNWGLTSKLFV